MQTCPVLRRKGLLPSPIIPPPNLPGFGQCMAPRLWLSDVKSPELHEFKVGHSDKVRYCLSACLSEDRPAIIMMRSVAAESCGMFNSGSTFSHVSRIESSVVLSHILGSRSQPVCLASRAARCRGALLYRL